MRKLVLLFLIIPTFLFAQRRDSVYIKTDIFEVGYSETKEQPLWVRYTVQCPVLSSDRYNQPNKAFQFNGGSHAEECQQLLNEALESHLGIPAELKLISED